MLHEINGLPAHVLLIHVIVVLTPLGALLTVLSAVWPAARRRIGIAAPITCLIVVAFTPIAVSAGEWLQHRLEQNGRNKAIERHADLGHTFLVFALALFVVSAAVWWIGRTVDAPARESEDLTVPAAGGGATATATATATEPRTVAPTAVVYAVQALAVVVSVVAVLQLVRIGDSGASAAWGFVGKL